MALYFLTYDLRKQRDYQKLYDELNNFQAVRVFQSTWCFNRYETTAEGLCNYFRNFVDSDDGLLVDESRDWATFNALGTPNDVK